MRYIGGKTQLLGDIETVINSNTTGREKVFCDIFSGTGSVARHFKPRYEMISNDILHFSYVIQKATVENNCVPKFHGLSKIGITDPVKFLEETDMTASVQASTFVSDNYSPSGSCTRMYISNDNAIRVDFIRSSIESWKQSGHIDETEYYYLLAALIEGVPFVSNIAGTYGAYLKKWDKRAFKKFEMARIEILDNGFENCSFNADSNNLIREIEGDILYVDPPYNSRQYAPNYHFLETISRYDNPEIRGVTGMRPYHDIKSSFCVKSEVMGVFEDLIAKAKFTNILISYSTDGLMTPSQIETVLKRYGDGRSYKKYDIPYRKYKSKLSDKASDLREYLFYIRKEIPKPLIFNAPKRVKQKISI
ncbi:MAG: DNA adenine methylase [Oscillospiraceae bacterium]|jgi:adenine-specific DNA-methyltransferase|nr:DNA adenine methylase [Oscillospiraceae bacterium]